MTNPRSQDAYVSNDAAVRKSCLGVIIKVQNQGLVAPLGLLHTLIAASADPKIPSLRTQADHVMHEINKVLEKHLQFSRFILLTFLDPKSQINNFK